MLADVVAHPICSRNVHQFKLTSQKPISYIRTSDYNLNLQCMFLQLVLHVLQSAQAPVVKLNS
jgi:hypothetical protein